MMRATRQHHPDGPSTLTDELISPHPLDESNNHVHRISPPLSVHRKPTAPTLTSRNAFLRLPPEVIQRILWIVDSNAFASLSLLNRRWYKEAQVLELYAHHLSRCPSYALTNNVITGPFRRNDLLRLKTKFAAEVRRNLFEAYLRPRETLVNLISINASSSAAFPGGEAFRFAFSPNGHTVLALSSSRIYVLDATSDPIGVCKELKTLRRPLSASITDDGSLLAVLSSKHQANIYGLTPNGPKHLQVLVLDNPPRTIALAHEGTVLAAAYEGGVEVFSLAANALSTDRRAVRSEAVDTLTFSGDGSMLVGSSQSLDEPNAVVITAPFYTENDPDMSSREIHSRMWTTQILFPQISSICSHAELLQGHAEGDASWLFAYDHTLMSYRAVRTDDTRTGVVYFLNPTTSRRFSSPAPSTAPTASACGSLVVAGFAGSGLSIYGVPERLDVSPDMGSVVERHEERMQGKMPLTSATGIIEPLMAYSPSVSGNSEEIENDSLAGKVDWRQSLFVKCRQLNTIEGYTATKWVERSEVRSCEFGGKRLVVVAPGGVNAFAQDLGDESMPVDGSRICFLDFDYVPSAGTHQELTIEVGDNEPELLTEHIGDLEIEVAMERRRTVRGIRGSETIDRGRITLGRSMTAASPMNTGSLTHGLRRTSASQPSSPSEGFNTQSRSPLSRTAPISQLGLQRSATAAGFQSARYPPRPPLGSNQYQSTGQVIYHRTNGRRDSAESWETPPPPYSNSPRTMNPNGGPYMSQVGSHWLGGPYGQSNGHMHTSSAGPGLPSQAYQDQVRFAGGGLQAGQSNGHAQAFRPRQLGSSNLATVNEFGVNHQDSRSEQTSQVISPIAPLPGQEFYFGATRPSTHDGFTSPQERFPLESTITHPIASPAPGRGQPVSLHLQNVDAAGDLPAGSITLTGANLQNRLNHPVPPAPNSVEQSGQEMHELASMGGHHGPTNQQTPQSSNAGQFVPMHPTASQMANLHRRMSGSRQQPLSVVTNGGRSNGIASQDFGRVPPSPPRAAWGAAGVPGSPSFNKARNSFNGPSLNTSGDSQRSITTSTSTPNLHAPQRPKYGRLDTIDSVSSAFEPGEAAVHSGAHGVAHEIPIPVRDQVAPPGERRIVTDSVLESKKRKGKRKKGDDGRPQTALGVREKKGTKCVVM